jgi:hypothetical protein
MFQCVLPPSSGIDMVSVVFANYAYMQSYCLPQPRIQGEQCVESVCQSSESALHITGSPIYA